MLLSTLPVMMSNPARPHMKKSLKKSGFEFKQNALQILICIYVNPVRPCGWAALINKNELVNELHSLAAETILCINKRIFYDFFHTGLICPYR